MFHPTYLYYLEHNLLLNAFPLYRKLRYAQVRVGSFRLLTRLKYSIVLIFPLYEVQARIYA